MKLIEIQTSNQGEELTFQDIDVVDLDGGMGDFIKKVIDKSKGADAACVWVSEDDELIDVYEIEKEVEANDLLEILNKIKQEHGVKV